MLHPRYLIKRGRLAILFAFLSAGPGVMQDPKIYRLTAEFTSKQAVPNWCVALFAISTLLLCFSFLQNVIDPRYTTPSQSSAAAALFLVIFGGAWVAGFHVRLYDLEPVALQPLPTTQHLALALIALSFSGALAGTLYNTVFVQKTDYLKLRSERESALSAIAAMQRVYRDDYLSTRNAEALNKTLSSAQATAGDCVKAEIPGYATWVNAVYTEPLAVLAAAAAAEGVREAPESFLRDCGLLDSGGKPEVVNALRRLREER